MPRWCPPIGRRIGSPSLRHLHYPAVAPGPAVSYQSFGAASVLGGSTPSRGPRGAGAHGYPGTPDRRLFGAWPNCRPCAECSPPKFIGGLSRTAMSVTLALVPCPRYGVSASLWCRAFRFWAVIPPRRRGSRRPVLAQTAATLQVSTPPGSGRFCRKTGSNLTPFRGSGRLFRFLAAIRVDVYGITPGQKHSHRRHPIPQPTKPPRTLLVRSAAERWMNIV